jgi:Fe-S-cluster containining protein
MSSSLSAAQRDALQRQDAQYLPLALPDSPGWDQVAAHLRHTVKLLKDRQASSPSARACGHINALFDRSVTVPPHAPLACSRGCAHCCRQPVLLYAPEAFFLAAHVRNHPEMAERVLRVAQTARQFPLGGIKGVECPLLEDNACALYAARPLSCHVFVSMNVNDCISVFRYLKETQIHQPQSFGSMRNLCRLLLLASLKAVGLPTRAYELNTAVATILAQDNAEKRWLRGEDVLAGLDTTAPPVPPEFADMIARWSAGVAETL